eukprot:Em0012g876a
MGYVGQAAECKCVYSEYSLFSCLYSIPKTFGDDGDIDYLQLGYMILWVSNDDCNDCHKLDKHRRPDAFLDDLLLRGVFGNIEDSTVFRNDESSLLAVLRSRGGRRIPGGIGIPVGDDQDHPDAPAGWGEEEEGAEEEEEGAEEEEERANEGANEGNQELQCRMRFTPASTQKMSSSTWTLKPNTTLNTPSQLPHHRTNLRPARRGRAGGIKGTATMPELLSFSDEKLNIAVLIGTKHIIFGIFLMEDKTGAIVEALEAEHRGNAERINMAILQRWLQGKETLTKAGIDRSSYAGHSFRIGAATSAAAAGVEDSMIQTLGRWKSSAYLVYVRVPRERLAAISTRLAG